jgi:hypothetical protein
MRQRNASRRAIVAFVLAMAIGGCHGEPGPPRDGSPVVSAESDAHRKALAETEQKIKKDKDAEAKAWRHKKNAPRVD